MGKNTKPPADQPQGNFAEPPPHAPRQVSSGSGALTLEQIEAKRAQATAHARAKAAGDSTYELPPPIQLMDSLEESQPPQADTTPIQEGPDPSSALPPDLPTTDSPSVPGDSLPMDPVPPLPPPPQLSPSAIAELEAEFLATHPAASNTDSPKRGIPHPSLDPGKQITGGFGQPGMFAQQYYGLDGLEIQQIVRKLWGDLDQAMQQDLRLGIASVYPQCRIRLSLQVDGIPGASINEAAFDISKQAGVQLVTITAGVQDDPTTPAGQLRDEAGLLQPGKRLVQAGATKILVDVPAETL